MNLIMNNKITIDSHNNRCWLNHRKDGPIYEDSNGTKVWMNNKGLWHREDGPAFEFSDGTREYWLNGELKNRKSIR